MNVAILTPSTGFSRMEYTYSLAHLIMYSAMNRLLPEEPHQRIDFHSVEGSGISANREKLVCNALNGDWSHILFIDEDMGFAPNALQILASRRQPIVGCNYPMRGENGGFTALSLDKTSRIYTGEKSTGLEPCWYTGFGFCLIDRKVFEQLPRPWFLLGYNKEGQYYSTEDSAFATLVHEAKIPWYVDQDASKFIIHVGNKKFVWNETISKPQPTKAEEEQSWRKVV